MRRVLFLAVLIWFGSTVLFSAVITKIALVPLSKTTILPGDRFSFSVTATYDDGKQKDIKSTSSKFKSLFSLELDGCSSHKGKIFVHKIRPADNKFSVNVVLKDNKALNTSLERVVDYFTDIKIKYEPTSIELGQKKLLTLDCKANTGDHIYIDQNSSTRKWEWFNIKTSKGSSFENGWLIISGDVKDFDCDTVRFSLHPIKADSVSEKASFTINYSKLFKADFNGPHGEEGKKGSNPKSNGGVGGDGATGAEGVDGKNLIVRLSLHECNRNLIKVEIEDTLAKAVSCFIINKNGGELDIYCNGGDGGDGGQGSDGKKGKNAGKKTEAQDGGDGGNGGHGGHGGHGGSVTIYSALNTSPYVELIKVVNRGGKAGKGGKKGKGKSGGKGNLSFADAHEGKDGTNGDAGKDGEDGGEPEIITQKIELNW